MIHEMTSQEFQLRRYIDELIELEESTDRGDDEYTPLREELDRAQMALVNPSVSPDDVLRKKQLTYGTRTGSGMYKVPRVTKVYFDEVESPEHAIGLGMKKDKGGWCVNLWSANVKVTEMEKALAERGITYPVSRFKVYNT
ncbi:hypothetical protein EniLVp02_0088 [Vibrio phage EniLVp02]